MYDWVPSKIYLLSCAFQYVLIFLQSLCITFTIRKFQQTFLCADGWSPTAPLGQIPYRFSHVLRIDSGSRESLGTLCPQAEPCCLCQLPRLTGLRDSMHEALQPCLYPFLESPGSPSPQALYLPLGPEPPYTAKHLERNRARDSEDELQTPRAKRTECPPPQKSCHSRIGG